ncbi:MULTISPECIES: hypothetical protein [Sphingobium]|uniref:hypothetical protein n=1 Tax=Sphingobium TaxID=165695 RepID=UPI0015EBBA1E|nr:MULTISPECIES: hypothetical protein [Sphingobium]MCW2363661.1 hypothetical protein [Sphingobium sp. B10D3B]MCW2402941.1 hypothetical protein [Sphingobium sp. B10D7B]MCW2409919.1 hypothetical protein [Sphingobium xanthum]
MLRRLTAFFALMILGSAVNAQADPRAFPSLAKRPVESRDRTVPPAPAIKPAATDPALATQVDRFTREAGSADTAFQSLLAGSRASVAAGAGAAPNSESWVTAQTAISALDSARYESVAALAALDTLFVERQDAEDAARVAADLAVIDPARVRVLAMVDAQNDALDALRRQLPQP